MPILSRGARWAVPALALALLAGCGGGDDEQSDPLVSSDSPSTTSTSAAPDPASDEQALRALIRRYDKALVRVIRTSAADGSLDKVATPGFAEESLGNYREQIYDEGLELVGDYKTEFESVQVDGDRAKVTVCSDGREVFIVKQGQEIPEGSTGQLRVPATFEAVRDEAGWLLDAVTNGSTEC